MLANMRTDAQDGSAWSDLNRPPLRVGPLRRALTDGEHPAWRALDVVAQTQSSNADVMARARAGEAAGYVLVADQQTAGRGRLGRAWTTPPRAALAVSVLLRPTAPMQRWAWLGQLAGLAVVDALTRTCGVPARLKWPNDVLVPDGGDPDAPYRKVCGILAEAAPPVVVVGVGINVSQSEAELPVPTATSLLLAGGATLDRDSVTRAYLRALATRYAAWDAVAGDPRASGLGAAYREACLTIGVSVRVLVTGSPDLLGQAEGVDDEGRLLVRTPDGVDHALAAGDVVHVR